MRLHTWLGYETRASGGLVYELQELAVIPPSSFPIRARKLTGTVLCVSGHERLGPGTSKRSTRLKLYFSVFWLE